MLLSLPLAFYGKFDVVDVVRDVWTNTWSEHPASEEAVVRMYLKEIVDIVQPRLLERSWEVKRQVRVKKMAGSARGHEKKNETNRN